MQTWITKSGTTYVLHMDHTLRVTRTDGKDYCPAGEFYPARFCGYRSGRAVFESGYNDPTWGRIETIITSPVVNTIGAPAPA